MKASQSSERMEAPPGFERFARLGVMVSNDARALMIRLLHLIRGHGIYKVRPSKENRENYTDFIIAVHDGWKLAQNLIAEQIISNLTMISALETQKIEYHKSKETIEKERVVEHIKRLNLENRIFRKYIDSIVWHMLFDEQSTIRRLPINKDIDNLSVKNIEDIQEITNKYNECPLNVAIMSDLTTFVHHGDIVLRSTSGIAFIEVKSGTKSKFILETMTQSEELDCKLAESILTRGFTKHEKHQYSRTKNQAQRGRNLSSTLKTNEGHDQLSGLKVKLQETQCDIQYYNDELLECRKRLEENGTYAINVIDGCLYIGMYKNPEKAYVAFSSWMKIIDCKNPIYNLTDSFFDALSRPLPSLYMPTEFVEEVMNGDIIVMGCLDTEKFFELSQKLYPSMLTLAPPPPHAKLGTMRVANKVIAISMTDTDSGGLGFLGDGLESRIKFDLQKPQNILKNQYATTKKYYYLPESQ